MVEYSQKSNENALVHYSPLYCNETPTRLHIFVNALYCTNDKSLILLLKTTKTFVYLLIIARRTCSSWQSIFYGLLRKYFVFTRNDKLKKYI